MGISFSCPLAEYTDVETGLESVIVRSINFGDEARTPVRSVSFNDRDSEPKILKSLGSRNMIFEGSVSFKGRDMETMLLIKAPSFDKDKVVVATSISPKRDEYLRSDSFLGITQQKPVVDASKPRHDAATKLQKVYKSFRTRRKLADCAVLAEQSWWKLLDFAELKRSSISFFDIEKPESASSRWWRARTRLAKVGKGLSKNDKARQLALQHWLEAIDPRHRYGHNLQFYYENWLRCQSREPFFYWLDIGEGKEVNLFEKCPRSKLQRQCIKYLGPIERRAYEVIVENGKFLYKQTGELLQTPEANDDAKWIFVLSTSKSLYVGRKKKGAFQHSSFLAGGATTAAGRLIVESGILKAVWPHSGHYKPTAENFEDFISFLKENNVDLTDVKMMPVDGEADLLGQQRSSKHLRNNSSEEDLTEEINVEDLTQDSLEFEQVTLSTPEQCKSRWLNNSGINLMNLEIPKRGVSYDGPETNKLDCESSSASTKPNLSDEERQENEDAEAVPKEVILQRINSHKKLQSYQLGRQLSCKWTTGAGPRIGCVRDYPLELQFRALEQVNLSPRSASRFRSSLSPQSPRRLSRKGSAPICLGGEMAESMSSLVLEKGSFGRRSIGPSRTLSSPLCKGTKQENL